MTDREPPTVSDNLDEATTVLPVVVPEAGEADATAVLPPAVFPPGGERAADPPAAETTVVTAAADDGGSAAVTRNSGVMALGSLVSRATGFLRTVVIGAAISAGVVGDSYQVANTLPNMVYELLLGGVLTSVIVPLIVKATKRDADGGEAYTHRLLTAATLLLGAATVCAVILAPLLTLLYRNNRTTPATSELTTTLAYLLLPEIFFYGIAALLAAVLNSRRHFAAPMWAPILNNLVVILTGVLFMLLPGPKVPTPETITGLQVAVLGIGTTLGIVLQAAALIPSLRKVGFRWKWRFDLRGTGLGEAVRLGMWALIYVAISQVGLFPVIWIAKYAGDHGGPGAFIHNNAYLLFMMVHGIVAVSILTALLPRMSAAAAEEKFGEVASNLSLGTRLSSVVLVPATAAYMALGVPLAVVTFQWGNFTSANAQATGTAIVAAAIGLVPFAISQMQLFAFYSMRDTKTPALLNLPVVAVKLAFDGLVLWLVPPLHIVLWLQFGNTLSYVVSAVVSGYLLRKRIGSLDGARTTQTLTRLAIASAVAGAAAWAVASAIAHWLGTGKSGSLAALAAGGLVIAVVYVAAATFLRVREVTEVFATVRRKLPGTA
ncbi:MAG: putative peptidoglycan lipid flippase [Cryptosporangiaceae bacterium]|nr:putative peptidoglycan lipid flippase [Cryptosporangiaceae bacterium]